MNEQTKPVSSQCCPTQLGISHVGLQQTAVVAGT